MRRCPHCQSAWVCWNWFHDAKEGTWGHECHNCSAAFQTNGHVDDGIPYKILMEFGQYFVEPGRFEAQWNKDMEYMQKEFGKQDDK